MWGLHPLQFTNVLLLISFVLSNGTNNRNLSNGELISIFLIVCSQVYAVQAVVMSSQIRLLASIDPNRRQASLMSVFISLIPLIGHVWNFMLVKRITGSLESEIKFRFTDRQGIGYDSLAGRIWSWWLLVSAFFPYVLVQLYDMTQVERGMVPILAFSCMGITPLGLGYSQILNGHRKTLLELGFSFKTEDQQDFDEEP